MHRGQAGKYDSNIGDHPPICTCVACCKGKRHLRWSLRHLRYGRLREQGGKWERVLFVGIATLAVVALGVYLVLERLQ